MPTDELDPAPAPAEPKIDADDFLKDTDLAPAVAAVFRRLNPDRLSRADWAKALTVYTGRI